MADGTTETVINCPACQTPLTIPIRLEMASTTEGVATFDTSAVREHVDQHQAADSEPCFGCGQPLTADDMVDHIAGHANGTIPLKAGWNDTTPAGASDA